MSIWNKVLVGVIAFASLFLFYMAARAVKLQNTWSESALKHEARIKQLNDQNRELLVGNGNQPGIRELKVELHKLLLDRRRVWPGCDPALRKPNRNLGTAEITATVNVVNASGDSLPHGIAKGIVLYAFEELNVKNKGNVLGDFDVGQYLGEFSVTAVAANKVTFQPTYVMTEKEIDRLMKARRPWVLYELLPRDSHEAFASLSDEQMKALLPPESVKDYLKDGKPAEKDDPQEYVVDGKYVRPLQDYSILFTDEHEKRMLLGDTIAALQQDKQLVLDALEEARSLSDGLTKEIAAAKAEDEKMEQQRDIVAAHLKNLEKKLGDMEAWIARLTETNRAMAGRIAKFQLEAAQRIDRRTREMAQSGTGRL
ncbi:MAG: hypothetical protein WCB27_02770 [Thermoguttaceae bacterium]